MQFPQTGHSQYNSNDRQKQAEDADVDAKRARQSVQQGALPRHIVEEENHGCDGNLDQRQEGQILGIIKGVGEKSRTQHQKHGSQEGQTPIPESPAQQPVKGKCAEVKKSQMLSDAASDKPSVN